MEKDIQDLIKQITSIEQMSPEQIPDIPLYMEQIIMLAQDKLSAYKRDDDDKILTKTMINNYTKLGLITPPIKKKYTKQNIISLILIYHLKSILSISDIKKLLTSVNDEEIEEIYSMFLSLYNKENDTFEKDVIQQFDLIKSKALNNNLTPLIVSIALIEQANRRKQLAEKIIDNYFHNGEK